MIELKHLRTLQTLRKTGSLVAAATQLHVSQSALSHQLNEIEQRMGYKLFIRKSQPLQFSQQGKIWLALADSILPQVNEALACCHPKTKATLKLAIESHSCIQWLRPTLYTFQHYYPDIEVEFESNHLFNLQPRLLDGQLDLLISADTLFDPQLIYQPLFTFEIRLIFAPDHAFSQQQKVNAVDLINQTLLTYPIDKAQVDIWQHFLQPAHISPTIKQVNNTALLLQMVAAGLGIAALPHWTIAELEQQGMITSRPLGNGLWRHLFAVTRPSVRDEAEINQLIDIIREQSQQTLLFTYSL